MYASIFVMCVCVCVVLCKCAREFVCGMCVCVCVCVCVCDCELGRQRVSCILCATFAVQAILSVYNVCVVDHCTV